MARRRLWFVVESSVDVRTVEGLSESFDLTVLARTISGGVEVSQRPAVDVRIIRSGQSHTGFALRVLTRLIAERRRVDLVVVQNYGLAALAANVAGRLARLPTLMQVGSPLEEYYRCRKADPRSEKAFRQWELAMLMVIARANAFIGQGYLVVSSHLASIVRGHGRRRPVEVCPIYGVDTTEFSPTESSKLELRRGLGLPEAGSIIFFSSRIAPEKDVDTLLRAFQSLVEEGREVWLLNSSGGHRELADLARHHGLENRVIARPAVDPRSDLARYYQAADVCVQASRAEGLGFSPLEALACGVPVVAANVGGLRETIVGGSTGWTYPPGDVEALAAAIAAVLDDPFEAGARTSRGRARVASVYDRDEVFRQMTNLLDRHVLASTRQLDEEPRTGAA